MAIQESPSACIAAEEGSIAKAVLMPGDPLRANLWRSHYLENPVCFNTVRNMLGYTGTYKGRKLSVMGHGAWASPLRDCMPMSCTIFTA